MCECGCGDLRPFGKLPAKGGWYALELYPGCADCSAGWAITVTFLKKGDEDTDWLLDDVEEISLAKHPFHFPILDPQTLKRLVMDEDEDPTDDDSAVAYVMDEFLRGNGLRSLFAESRRVFAPHPETPGGQP